MVKKTTMSDIAERLGISTVTVSKALAGQKGVSEELRERITRTAAELRYEKGKRPAKGSYHTVAVVVAERYLTESQSFYWKMYQELSRHAAARNCGIFLEVIDRPEEDLCELPRMISDGKAEGLIVLGVFSRKYMSMLEHELKSPVVWLDNEPGIPGADMVVTDNVLGGYQMTNYLFEMGHRHIYFVGTLQQTNSIDDRYLGYLKAFLEHGVPLPESRVIDDRNERGEIYEAGVLELPWDDMPTAFFCNCDVTADRVIRRLEQEGLRVPDDISVAGFDNYVGSLKIYRDITTYEIDIPEMSRRAIHTILHKLNDVAYSTGKFVLAGRFVDKRSVSKVGEPVPFVC